MREQDFITTLETISQMQTENTTMALSDWEHIVSLIKEQCEKPYNSNKQYDILFSQLIKSEAVKIAIRYNSCQLDRVNKDSLLELLLKLNKQGEDLMNSGLDIATIDQLDEISTCYLNE